MGWKGQCEWWLCTGGSETVTFNAKALSQNPTATPTFTVNKPADVVITKPADTTVNACDYKDQAALDAAIKAWAGRASVSGGCAPTLTNDAAAASALCTGGSVTVTFTAKDLCQNPTATATFTVNKPADVVITKPADTTVNACDYKDQAALDAAIKAWAGRASVSGGCAPTLTNDAAAASALCTGGSVTVTFTAKDLCQNPTATATFTVNKPADVVITKPADTTVNACDYPDQAALDAAIKAWAGRASVTGGCAPTLTNDAAAASGLCTGGSVTVTFTAKDLCQNPTATATFTVNKPADVTVNACDYPDQAALDAAIKAWAGRASVTGGCAPTLTNDAAAASGLCT